MGAFRRALMRMSRGIHGANNPQRQAQQHMPRGGFPHISGQGATRQLQEAVRKIKEHENRAGAKFQEGMKNPLIQHRKALSREKREVMGKIRELLDPKGLMKADPERLRRGIGEEQEMHHLLTLFYNALLNGEVRNFKDFERYLANFLKQTGQDSRYAPIAVRRMVNRITRERRRRLEQEFMNLAAISRGNSPFD